MNREQETTVLTNFAGAWMLINGQELPGVVIPTILKALKPYTPESILTAIESVVLAGVGRMTLASIIERLDAADGRPSPEEAWSTAVQTHNDEQSTVVWTQETATAWHDVASALMDAGDRFNASRGFIAKYTDLVAASRRNGNPVQWLVCQGWDKELRHQAIQQAVEAGRITREYAAKIHPRHNLDAGPIVAAIAGKTVTLLNDNSATTTQQHLDRVDELQRSQSRISEILNGLRASLEADGKKPKPTTEQNTRIVNEAIESGVLRTVSDIDHWMTKATQREDLADLQVLILNRHSEARRHG